MRPLLVLLTPLLVTQTSAQSTAPDILGSLASQAFSVFTSLTSALGNTPSSSPTRSSASPTTSDDSQSLFPPLTSSLASVTSASTSARSRITSALSSPITSASTGSSISQVTPSPTSASSSASQSGAAAAASTAATSPAAASGGSNHDRNLAIILGTVLGALALGLFILLLLLLCRRRRRRAANSAASASLTSTSDEALTPHKTTRSRKVPLAAVFASRKSRTRDHRTDGAAPLMSERSNYNVPSAHEFGHSDTAPFVPRSGEPRRSSGILPTPAASGVNTSGGLNSHPYRENHHASTALAAGAGGAALGAAAARNSRSNERRHEPRPSENSEVHPAFWDEPPPRSPHRNSMDSGRSRRSGSMARNSLQGPQDQIGSPLRNSMSATGAGGLAGAVVSGVPGRNGRRSHERGRSISTNPPSYDASTTVPVSNMSGGMTTTTPVASHTGPGTANQDSTDLTHFTTTSSVAGGAAPGAGLASHNRSRSRPRSYPPLPSSLIIPDPNARRNVPSRSPKRTRFAPDTYHEPMPYENDRVSQPRMEQNDAWNSMGSPARADTPVMNELVSPISPEDTTRSFEHSRLATPGRANDAKVARSRSISPNITSRHSNPFLADNRPISPPTTDSYSTSNSDNVASTSYPPRAPAAPRQNSGLIHAVQDHFNPNATTGTLQHQNHPPAYTAYTPSEKVHPSAHQATGPNRIPNPLPRKPVPYRAYSGDSGHGTAWRGEEDSAWEQSYSSPTGTGIGQAR